MLWEPALADDKLVFLWVPDMIKNYLGRRPHSGAGNLLRPALPGTDRQYVLQNMDNLVLKTRQGYGGLGVFIMPDLGRHLQGAD